MEEGTQILALEMDEGELIDKMACEAIENESPTLIYAYDREGRQLISVEI